MSLYANIGRRRRPGGGDVGGGGYNFATPQVKVDTTFQRALNGALSDIFGAQRRAQERNRQIEAQAAADAEKVRAEGANADLNATLMGQFAPPPVEGMDRKAAQDLAKTGEQIQKDKRKLEDVTAAEPGAVHEKEFSLQEHGTAEYERKQAAKRAAEERQARATESRQRSLESADIAESNRQASRQRMESTRGAKPEKSKADYYQSAKTDLANEAEQRTGVRPTADMLDLVEIQFRADQLRKQDIEAGFERDTTRAAQPAPGRLPPATSPEDIAKAGESKYQMKPAMRQWKYATWLKALGDPRMAMEMASEAERQGRAAAAEVSGQPVEAASGRTETVVASTANAGIGSSNRPPAKRLTPAEAARGKMASGAAGVPNATPPMPLSSALGPASTPPAPAAPSQPQAPPALPSVQVTPQMMAAPQLNAAATGPLQVTRPPAPTPEDVTATVGHKALNVAKAVGQGVMTPVNAAFEAADVGLGKLGSLSGQAMGLPPNEKAFSQQAREAFVPSGPNETTIADRAAIVPGILNDIGRASPQAQAGISALLGPAVEAAASLAPAMAVTGPLGALGKLGQTIEAGINLGMTMQAGEGGLAAAQRAVQIIKEKGLTVEALGEVGHVLVDGVFVYMGGKGMLKAGGPKTPSHTEPVREGAPPVQPKPVSITTERAPEAPKPIVERARAKMGLEQPVEIGDGFASMRNPATGSERLVGKNGERLTITEEADRIVGDGWGNGGVKGAFENALSKAEQIAAERGKPLVLSAQSMTGPAQKFADRMIASGRFVPEKGGLRVVPGKGPVAPEAVPTAPEAGLPGEEPIGTAGGKMRIAGEGGEPSTAEPPPVPEEAPPQKSPGLLKQTWQRISAPITKRLGEMKSVDGRPVGKVFAKAVVDARESGEVQTAQANGVFSDAMDRYRSEDPNWKNGKVEVAKALDGQVKPDTLNQGQRNLYEAVRQVLQRVKERAIQMEVFSGQGIRQYLPRFREGRMEFDALVDSHAEYLQSPAGAKELTQLQARAKMAKQGLAGEPTVRDLAAMDLTKNFGNQAWHKKSGHLEKERVNFEKGGYSLDLEDIMPQYLSEAYKRIGQAEHLGPKSEVAKLGAGMLEPADRKYVQDAMGVIMGTRQEGLLGSGVRRGGRELNQLQAVVKLASSAFRQLSQNSVAWAHMNSRHGFVKGTGIVLRSAADFATKAKQMYRQSEGAASTAADVGREIADRWGGSGTTVGKFAKNIMSLGGRFKPGGKLVEGVYGVREVDKFGRVWADQMGRYSLVDAVRKGDRALVEELVGKQRADAALSTDPKLLAENIAAGRSHLLLDSAGKYVADRTNYRTTPENVPLGFHHPGLQMFNSFLNYSYQHWRWLASEAGQARAAVKSGDTAAVRKHSAAIVNYALVTAPVFGYLSMSLKSLATGHGVAEKDVSEEDSLGKALATLGTSPLDPQSLKGWEKALAVVQAVQYAGGIGYIGEMAQRGAQSVERVKNKTGRERAVEAIPGMLGAPTETVVDIGKAGLEGVSLAYKKATETDTPEDWKIFYNTWIDAATKHFIPNFLGLGSGARTQAKARLGITSEKYPIVNPGWMGYIFGTADDWSLRHGAQSTATERAREQMSQRKATERKKAQAHRGAAWRREEAARRMGRPSVLTTGDSEQSAP